MILITRISLVVIIVIIKFLQRHKRATEALYLVLFLRYSMSTNILTLKSGSEVTQCHQIRHVSIRHLGLPINVSLVTMGLSRTVCEIDSDFSRTSQIFPTSVYFTPPLTGFLLELGISARFERLESYRAIRWSKKF